MDKVLTKGEVFYNYLDSTMKAESFEEFEKEIAECDDVDITNGMISVYKAMDEWAKVMSIRFAKWLRGQIIPLYVYDKNDMWEVLAPSKTPTEPKFISSDELYNLFLESIKEEQQ